SGCSKDGRVIVGNAQNNADPAQATINEAFIWRPSHGAEFLTDVAHNEFGIDVGTGHLPGATAISADGRTIVGPGYVLYLGPKCAADVDDGSGTGTPDGGVGLEDLFFFFDMYDAGDPAADIDDGSGTGHWNGGVGIEDALYFLNRFDAGC